MPCMSGSSKRTNPTSSFCQPSSIFFTSLMDRLPPVPRNDSRCGGYTVTTRWSATGPCPTLGERAAAGRARESRMAQSSIESDRTQVLPLELGRAMPLIVRGEGVWVEDAAGRHYLDAMSGGSMAATLGHGRRDIIQAARVGGIV